ncbi:hypothetical protein llap_15953 [Limosa lapponica baueri]|uniref:Cadherin domain-containing protein n=1 Tax=Limosa lapponica baueri TaxID=1758121 RepID=A0A2I0TJ06_LIMLA|nr:hypothetical protein llap_15953 [Limosa lapponica baueri]
MPVPFCKFSPKAVGSVFPGVITTTQSFDREKQREYTLSVTATDQAQEPLIGVCQVTVLIADVNDNDPKFENSRYQFAEPLDFETTKFFTLIVRAQNVAMTPLASFTTVCVNVTDVNDNVPFFVSSNYEVSVPEGADVGTSVVQVLATDLDSGLHGEVHYLILKDASEDYQFFTIEPETGIISTRASFDREKRASYLIEVQSQDSSESARPGVHGQPNTDTAYVRIFVSDVNDNAPAFPRSVYEVSVDEDREVGSPVVTATAEDEDEGANAKLRYQITSGNARGVFDVEPDVGTVFIAQPLDYEQEQHYELRLVASDGKWENHTLIIINVVNKNDEAPVFTQNEYQGSVLEELTDLPVLVLKAVHDVY